MTDDNLLFAQPTCDNLDAWYLRQNPHFPQSLRNPLWSDHLNAFVSTSAPSGVMESSGKHFQHDTPRMLPPSSPLSPGKLQSTVCYFPVLFDFHYCHTDPVDIGFYP